MFETFIVGDNNRFAQVSALAVAELPGEAYNPLYIHGRPGLGKTYLMSFIQLGNRLLLHQICFADLPHVFRRTT